jgi:hypothetical protein
MLFERENVETENIKKKAIEPALPVWAAGGLQ